MSVGLRLDLRQTQQLVMTPQLQQAIKLLQMSNLELAAFVAEAAEGNPLIELRQGDGAADGPAGERLRDAADERRAATGDPVEADRRVTAEGDHALAAETFDTGAENLHDRAPGDGPEAGAAGDGPEAGAAAGDGPDAGAGRGVAEGGFPAGERRAGRGAAAMEGAPGLEERLAARPSLREHLLAQLGQARAPAPRALVAMHLVDELDEHGYFRGDLDAVAARLGVPPAEAGAALALLQGCEPTGVGARGLAECLGLQLAERGRLDPAMRALLDNLELLARGDWKRLRAACGVDAEDLGEMVAEIRRLDPRPCAGFGAVEPETLIPDILLRRTGWGGWHLELNPETLPRVLMDRSYAATVGAGRDAETRRYLADCRASAGWLIRSLDQRARTILKIATEIVRQQQRFFDEGIAGLRPLNLRTVADAVGMHESTASRVTSNKTIATERGIFELRFFFTNAVGGEGGDVAAASVRHRIRAMVDAEDPADILSDDTIVDRLQREGIDIARRTVAKYRKALNIPSSVERRRRKSAAAPG